MNVLWNVICIIIQLNLFTKSLYTTSISLPQHVGNCFIGLCIYKPYWYNLAMTAHFSRNKGAVVYVEV